jgi:predicted aspartyl protease
MEQTFCMRVAGILGLPGLPRRFRLDFEKQQIGRFPSEMGPDWLEIPLETDADGLLRVLLTVDKEHTVDAVLDTAFAGTLGLPADLLERWGLLSEDTPRLRPADPGAVRDALQIRLTECAAGAVEVNKPLCSVLEDAGPRIGVRFLSRFEIAIDREGGKLFLRPRVALPWTDPPLRGAGLAPAERVNGRWSLFVAEDSPAWIAGIEPGDVLGTVNGVDMAGQSFGFVQRALSGKPDTFLDVTILRGNEVLEFRVAIEEML